MALEQHFVSDDQLSAVGGVHTGLSCDMGRDTVEETAVTAA